MNCPIAAALLIPNARVYRAEERWRCEVRSATEFARITPEQKVRIVNALKANGEIVAMTGEYFEFLTGHETCGVKVRQPSVRDLCRKLGHTPEPA